jgi:hypothetical protein
MRENSKYGERTMKNGTRILAMAAVLTMGVVVAQGEILARWNTEGADNALGSYEATACADGITASALHIGGGLKAGGSTAANIFAATGYDQTSAKTAMSAGDYWETSLTVASGNELQLTGVTIGFGGPKSGPQTCQLAWSADNKTTWTYLKEFDLGRKDTKYFKLNLAADDLGDLAYGVTGTVWFRLVAWGGSGAGSFGQKTDGLVFNGELVSAEGEPTVGFVPASPWTYAKETLVVQVKARPAGTKVTSMSVSPKPNGAVSSNLTAGTWTFTPSTNDANKSFMLTAVATNNYGRTTNSVDVRVKGVVTKGTLTIDFEGVTGEQTSWNGATLSLPAGSGTNWVLEGSIVRNGYSSDRKNEKSALVFTSNAVGSIRSQGKVLDKGIGKISYCYGVNTNHLDAGRPVLRTLVSEDGEFWVEADAADTAELGNDGELAERSFDVGVGVPVYLEFRCDGFSGSAQVNLDDVVIQPKAAGTPYEQKLLKFNVTPGDPGTDSSQDLDDDSVTNSSDKNPYDPDVK